jgi:hypothetical protein
MRTHSVASVRALDVTSSGCTTFSSSMSVTEPCDNTTHPQSLSIWGRRRFSFHAGVRALDVTSSGCTTFSSSMSVTEPCNNKPTATATQHATYLNFPACMLHLAYGLGSRPGIVSRTAGCLRLVNHLHLPDVCCQQTRRLKPLLWHCAHNHGRSPPMRK